MSGDLAALHAHLATGDTTVCRCWQVRRRDGVVLGFTDHDRDLGFDGVRFRADTGLSGRAYQSSTGLSVDNAAALGLLSDDAIRAEDIDAGRYDGAEVTTWRVNWTEVAAREVEFRGTIGEITRSGNRFEAELRGLAEALNRPDGLVFQRQCSAVLGDARCKVDLTRPADSWTTEVITWGPGAEGLLPAATIYPERWFAAGRLEVIAGSAEGLAGVVKIDRATPEGRRIELWDSLRAEVRPGDQVRLVAGCDRSGTTCTAKFNNFLNFRGFPHVPGEDWVMSYPARERRRDGGSRSA
jgi:uncharacterized phage protein (TIGR02218 family)